MTPNLCTTTIRRALNYLGLSAVKSIVLGFSLVESTRGVAGNDAFDIDDHWRRSIFGAAAALVVFRKSRRCIRSLPTVRRSKRTAGHQTGSASGVQPAGGARPRIAIGAVRNGDRQAVRGEAIRPWR